HCSETPGTWEVAALEDQPSEAPPDIAVSAVIPTYRRPELLERCLLALAAQDLERRLYEVIVVDDAGCAETRKLVLGWRRSGLRPRYLRRQGAPGPAAARNRGWQAAIGPIVAFTDDDCVPDRDWLRR